MRAQSKAAVVVAVALAAYPGVARADDAASFSDTLTGDWGGYRSWLRDLGIDFQLGYTSETASNVQGGTKEGTRYTDQWAFGSTLDLQKLLGLNDAKFQVTITDRNGRNLSSDEHLGTLQQVQEVYGRGQTVRLTQLWYEQTFGQGDFALKIGRATVGEDFDSFNCYFMNLSFCGSQPGNLAGSYWYNWPVSQWTGRLRYHDGNRYIQAAVYEINPHNLDNNFSFGKFDGATGVLLPFEIGLNPDPTATGGISFYKLGGWYSNAPGNDVFLDVNYQPLALTHGAPLQRPDRYGIWFSGQQQIFGTAVDGNFVSGLAVFLNVTFTDHRSSTIDDQIAGGLWWKGFIAALPDDVLGVGFARTHVNANVARGERLSDTIIQHSEYAGEIYYSLHPFDWLEMRPNFQWIHHPGGDGNAADIGVMGMKAGITL